MQPIFFIIFFLRIFIDNLILLRLSVIVMFGFSFLFLLVYR